MKWPYQEKPTPEEEQAAVDLYSTLEAAIPGGNLIHDVAFAGLLLSIQAAIEIGIPPKEFGARAHKLMESVIEQRKKKLQ